MARSRTGVRLKVWHWHGRELVSHADIDMVIATGTLHEVHGHTVRLTLPKPRPLRRVRPGRPEFEEALRRPGRLVWADEDDMMAGRWRTEEELEELRAWRAQDRRARHR